MPRAGNDMRIVAGRITALLSVALLVAGAAACSGEPDSPAGRAARQEASDSSPTPTADPSSGPHTPSPQSPEPTESATATFQLWFVQGRRLAQSTATRPATARVGTAALDALLEGPPAGEGELFTAIPSDAAVNELRIDGGLATVDLSSSFEAGSGTASMGFRLGQIVFTLTQFPTVRRVAFEIDGEPVRVFSSEGLVIDKPLTRRDFEDQAPPIIVDRPLATARVSSPMTVAGSANVFEATVSIRLETEEGATISESFTTATCGSGCRGTYRTQVEFDVDRPTPAKLVVYESSAEDGSELHALTVPVTLLPQP